MNSLPIHKCYLPEAKILADLQSVANDLHLVSDILTKWLGVQGDTVLARALFSAGLITYRRCFASGVRNSLTREDVAAIPNNATELHDYLIHQANKLIAHSVNPFEQTNIGIAVVNGQADGVATLSGQLVALNGPEIKQWGRLVGLLGNTVLNPRIDEAQAAVLAAAKALPITEITRAPILRYTVPRPEEAGTRRT